MVDTFHEESKQKLINSIIVILVVAGLVLYVDRLQQPGPSTAFAYMQGISSQPPPDTSAVANRSIPLILNDGSYEATADYAVPHDMEAIKVSVSLTGGVVTRVSIVNKEGNPDSAQYQRDFVRVYQNYVVGRKISDLHVSI